MHLKYGEVTGRKGHEEHPELCRGSDKRPVLLGPELGELWEPGEQTGRRTVQLKGKGLVAGASLVARW